jgi:hypothetical protein
MNSDYINMVEIVNKNITRFNELLASSNPIPLIEQDKVYDDKYFTKLTETTWFELRFPNAEKKGIYLIFGYDSKDFSKKSMYIGKASFSSSIGKRLYNHLIKDKDNDNYTMYDLSGNIHNLEYVFGLDLETRGLDIFSSSLEEFLIRNVKYDIALLNGTGNFN